MKRFVRTKRGVAAIILILVLVLVLASTQFERIIRDHIHVGINSVTMESIGLTRMDTVIDFDIENKNWLGFTVERVEFGIYFDEDGEWLRLGGGELMDLNLGAGKEANRQVSVTISNLQLVRLIVGAGLSLGSDSEAPKLVVKGTAWVDVGPFTVEKKFSETPAQILG